MSDLSLCAICKIVPPRKGAMCCEPCRFKVFGEEQLYTRNDIRRAFETGQRSSVQMGNENHTGLKTFDDYMEFIRKLNENRDRLS